MQAPLIDIHNATVYRERHKVFENFSLSIAEGQSTALLGPNGAGKTTLLRLLTRELYPVPRPGSHVRIRGKELFSVWDLRRTIGIVSHEMQHQFLRALPGLEVVLSGFAASVGLAGVNYTISDEQRDVALATMARLGIEALAATRFDRMSTGQQRRTLLARSLVHDPESLVLDEPTNGLDLKMAHDYLRILRDLIRDGRTIVLATHHVSEILPEIDRVVMLKDCRLFLDGPKTEVLTSNNLSQLYDTPVHLVRKNRFYLPYPDDDRD